MLDYTVRARTLLAATIPVALCACPSFASSGTVARQSQGMAGTDAAAVDASNAGADAAIADVLAAAQAQAESERFGAAPREETLCLIRFGHDDDPGSDLDGIKALLGPPSEEAASKTDAGLEYLYKGGQSIFFAFKWRDEVCEISVSCSDVFPTYYVTEANVTMMPYPDCWPHKSAD